MRVLITGCGGQVGVELIDYLLQQGEEVIATDIVDRPAAANQEVPWHHLDVTDADAVLAAVKEHEPDSVYHLAAILSAAGEAKPDLAYAVNQVGTHSVLEACRHGGCPQLIFTSTIAAFGPGLADPVPNEVSMRPTTMYGATKVAGELLGEYYDRRGWVDFRGVRFPGLISAGVPGGGTSDYALYMYTEGMKSGRYKAFCEPRARIPFMYMPDAVRSLHQISLADEERLGRHIYNIAAMSPTADEIADSVGAAIPGVEITFEPDPARQAILDSWPRALDDSLARAEWGWYHDYDLEAMTADMVVRVREMIDRGVL